MAVEPGSPQKPVIQENAIVKGIDPPRLDLFLAKAYELLDTTINGIRNNRELISDIASTVLRAFIERPAGYLAEKVDADTGWVFPVPDETYAHGHDAMLGHMVEAFRAGVEPRETFHDGLAVNRILDAAYRSIRSGRWEPVGA